MKRISIVAFIIVTFLIFDNSAFAVLMKMEFAGEANTLGFNSSTEFHGSSIVGSMTYDTESPPTATNELGWEYRFGDAMTDFSFTITFPDNSTYFSPGLFVNINGEALGHFNIENSYPPRIDLNAQGIFIGDPFNTQKVSGFWFNLQDGYKNPNPPMVGNAGDREATVLSPDKLPDTPFTLEDIETGAANLMLTWQNVLNGPSYRFQSFLTSLDVSQVIDQGPDPDPAPVPEPATILLLGTGLIGLAGLKRRFKK